MTSDPLQGSMIVLHGPPKVGKTQLASKFPGPVLFFGTEPGHKYIPESQQKRLVRVAPDGWEDFTSSISGMRKARTVVVDTVSGLYLICFNHVCEKKGWDHPNDAPHGQGWNAIRREFSNQISKLAFKTEKMGATLIMIDHSKEELVETATANIEKVTCAMPGQARSIILPVPDHIWFMGYMERGAQDALKNTQTKRALFVGGSQSVEAGCRDPEVNPIRRIAPLSIDKPYQQIVKKLYGETA